MEVLGHVGIAEFGGETVVDKVAATEAGLERGVVLVTDSETCEIEAEIDLEAVADAPVVFSIGTDFVGKDFVLV